MIRRVKIRNLVLIAEAEVFFGEGFTAISGETGSGKSVLIEALKLATGSRAESDLIRKGEEKATVEVEFSVGKLPHLEEAGVEEEDPLIIRREIHQEGKNRCFVNGCQVPLSLLQKVGILLIDFVDQSSFALLKKQQYHRELLDDLWSLGDLLKELQGAKEEEKALLKRKEELLLLQEKKATLLPLIEEELKEFVSFTDEEEKRTFDRYSKIEQSYKELENLHEVRTLLSPALAGIKRAKQKMAKLADVVASLEDVVAEIDSRLEDLEISPNERVGLEQKVSQFYKLKRRFGETDEKRKAYLDDLNAKKEELSSLDIELTELEKTLKKASDVRSHVETLIADERKKHAPPTEKALTELLRKLNMSSATLKIDPAPVLFLKANEGESFGKVEEVSSGGELCRLLLCFKLLLAEKNQTHTLIFDEIDAHVGGETAGKLAEELKKLSEHKQVICITHFPQTTLFADRHLKVEKKETEGRTTATIALLGKKERQMELKRMVGGALLLLCSLQLNASDYFFVMKGHPWHLEGDYTLLSPPEFRHKHKWGDFHYQEAHSSLFYTQFIGGTPRNTLSWEVGCDYFKLDWDKNPRFKEKDFYYLNVSGGYTSLALDGWRWVIKLGGTVDAQHWEIQKTAVGYGMLWGRYSEFATVGVHAGMVGYAGVKNSYVVPILGIDWLINRWKINAIFPLDFSLEYIFSQAFQLNLAYSSIGGPYRYPRRAFDGINGYKHPILMVYANGIALTGIYIPVGSVKLELTAGYNTGGWIMISDDNNHHKKYFPFEASPYGSIAAAFSF